MGNKYAINTPQQARIRILDQCFANPAIKWTRERLINKVIEEMESNPDLISYKSTREYSDRTFANDKKYLGKVLVTKSDEDNLQGNHKYRIEVKKEHTTLGKQLTYYRYSHTNRSFLDNKLSSDEVQKLMDAVQLIQQIKGFDSDNEINSILKGLDAQIKYHSSGGQQVIGLQTVVADGYNYLDDLYNCVINKRVIEIEYEPFEEKSLKKVVHPYFIKQYNNRWFLLGYDESRNDISNIPLDRIKGKLKPLNNDYKSPENIFNPDDFFKDIIGVTNRSDYPVEEIVLEFSQKRAPYILTKKIHESQHLLERKENGCIIISLRVKQNFELISLILGHGSQVTVLQPRSLAEEIKKQALEITKKYLFL